MLRKMLGLIVLTLFLVSVFLYFRTGMYKGVTVSTTTPPQLKLFYKEFVGPYHQIIETLKEVEAEFKTLGIECPLTFGHFLSDPEEVDHEKLVSHVGCAFPENKSPQLFTLPNGINETSFGIDFSPETKCYLGTFSGSPSLTAMKVYPKIEKELKEKGIKAHSGALEVYKISGTNVTTDIYICGLKAK